MTGFSLQYSGTGFWYGVFAHFATHGLRHGVSGRLGGVSEGQCAGANMALHTGDEVAKVVSNRRLFCQAIGVPFERLVSPEQVHGDRVVVVDEALAGRGALDYTAAIKNCDALITATPDIPLLLCYADCVPVLLADPVRRVIAVVHAGWRGTVAAIARKTLQRMQRDFNCRPEDCLAAIAPSIGPCCYQVDEPVEAQIRHAFGETAAARLLTPTGKMRWQLDLWEANRWQLAEAGIPAAQIIGSQVCTACNTNLFFSYRAEQGNTGRIGAMLSL